MLTLSKPRQLINFVRFMTCGKGNNSDNKDSCEEISETETEQESCDKKENVCDNNYKEEDEDWKTKFCTTPKKCSQFPIPEIDLSDPCGKQCRPPPPPSPPEPKESCFCYDDIELCPPTEEIRRRYNMWRLASFAVFPIIGLALSLILPAHRKHQEEIEERMRNSEFIPYPYMHRITKPWWWGDGHHGLFFNPKVNKVPPEFDQTISKEENKNDSKCSDTNENDYADEDDNYNENYNDNSYGQETQFRNGYPYGNGSRNGKNNRRREN